MCASVQVATVIGRDRIYFSSDWITSTVWKFLFRLLFCFLHGSNNSIIRCIFDRKIRHLLLGRWTVVEFSLSSIRLFIQHVLSINRLPPERQNAAFFVYFVYFSCLCLIFCIFSFFLLSSFFASSTHFRACACNVIIVWIFQLQTGLFFAWFVYFHECLTVSRLIELLYVVCERRQVPAAWISNQYRTRTTK